jgi:hypothetical protein
MKMPRCSCGWMAVCTMVSRIGVIWYCVNPDCQYSREQIEPVWVEVRES